MENAKARKPVSWLANRAAGRINRPPPGLANRAAGRIKRPPPGLAEGGWAFILKTILIFVLVYLLFGLLASLETLLWFLGPLIFFMYIWFKSIQSCEPVSNVLRENITFMPLAYTENELRLDRRLWATYALILANVSIHYLIIVIFPESRIHVIYRFMFLPTEGGWLNYLLSPLTSMFLHSNAGHLWWNMVFLWSFGVVVERRIGWKRFLGLYLATGILGDIIFGMVELMLTQTIFHSIGASGAISGIMGVFMIRMHYKQMAFPLPILGFFSLVIPAGLKIRLNSLIVIALYFVSDLKGGLMQIRGEISNHTGYWAHLGAMAAGILLALRLKLQKDAVEEMHVEQAKEALAKNKLFADPEKSLRLALERNPENVEALLLLARHKSRSTATAEGKELYQQAIALTMKTDVRQAADIFVEFYQLFHSGVDPDSQYRLAAVLYRQGNRDAAARALEMLIDDPAVPAGIREKSLFQLGLTLAELGLQDAARFRFGQYLDRYPDSPQAPAIRQRLSS